MVRFLIEQDSGLIQRLIRGILRPKSAHLGNAVARKPESGVSAAMRWNQTGQIQAVREVKSQCILSLKRS